MQYQSCLLLLLRWSSLLILFVGDLFGAAVADLGGGGALGASAPPAESMVKKS